MPNTNGNFFQKLNSIESKYDELTQQLSSAEVLADSSRYQKLARTHAELAEVVNKYREWRDIDKNLTGARQLVVEADDPEMKQMAHDEERTLTEKLQTVERELKVLLLPRDQIGRASCRERV